MIRIGEFSSSGEGYRGRLILLGVEAELTLVPVAEAAAPNAPNYRIHADDSAEGREVGAAWMHHSERAGAYLALRIDDPQWPRAIRANLFRPTAESGPHQLFWQRRQRRREPDGRG